jgi:mono/diheme cytochrome c family protein
MGTSFSFAASQNSAIQSPASAPVSSAASVTPDPNFTPPTSVTLDGVALYAGACASCHGPLATSTKLNRTAQNISDAIIAVPRMNSLSSLTPAQIQAIATALVK